MLSASKYHKNKTPTAAEKAGILWDYVYKLTANEKRFPKRYRESVVTKIEGLADILFTEIRLADEIYPTTKESFDSKITHYREGLSTTRTLSSLMKLISENENFHLTDKELKNIGGMVTAISNMVINLIKTTKERFPKYDDEELFKKQKKA